MRIDGLIRNLLLAMMAWGLAVGSVQAQFAGGDGSPGDPFQIANESQLLSIKDNPSAAYKLIDDISVSQFTNVVLFTGQLDGRGHTLDFNINESGGDRYGLFRELGDGGEIRDLRLTGQISLADALYSGALAAEMSGGLIEQVHTDVTLTVAGTRHVDPDSSRTGGLVASKTGGTIRQSSNSGLVRGYLGVGGLAALNMGGLIERSFNTGTVWATGVNGAGGITYNNRASIVEVYSTGRVTGSRSGGLVESGCFNCGGLVGVMSRKDSKLQRSYSTGFVNSSDSLSGALVGQLTGGTVDDLFFDEQTSGQIQGAAGSKGNDLAGTGRTTAKMKDSATFTAAGWDFDDVWQVATTDDADAEAISYPYFQALTYDPFDQELADSPAPGIVGPARRFVLQGASSQVAGQGQDPTIRAHDVRDQLVELYDGIKVVTFDGAGPAPDGTAPFITDRLTQPRAFGEPVELNFVDGVAEVLGGLVLFKAASLTLTATADDIVTEPGDGLDITVLPDQLEFIGMMLESPQVNGQPFTGENLVGLFDQYFNFLTNFDASTNPITLVSQAGGQLSGLGGTSGAVLDQASDFSGGVADLTGRLVYTGAVSNAPMLLSSSSGEAAVSQLVQIVAGAPTALMVESGDAQVAEVATTLPAAPRVLLVDVSGNPVADEPVEFQVLTGGGSVTGQSALTDNDGLAQLGSWTLGSVAGANGLRASSGSLTVDFSATGLPGAPAEFVIVAGDNQSGVAGTAVAMPPQVRVQDANGNPVPGVTVEWVVTGGGGLLTGETVVTDSQGLASVGSWSLGTTAGNNGLMASAGLLQASFGATGVAGAPTQIERVAGDAQIGVVDTVLATPATVRLRDANNNLVPDVSVVFAIAQGDGEVTGASAVTDGDGEAAVGAWTLGTVAGRNGLTAAAAGLETLFAATAVADVASQLQIQAGDGQSGEVATPLPVAPAVLVRDEFDNPVPDVSVTFAVTSGGGSLASDMAVTDSDGIAAAGAWTLGETAGEQTVRVTIAGLDLVVLMATATASAPVETVTKRGDNQAVLSGRPVRVPPAVIVRDTYGNPVSGVLMVFSLVEGGGSVSEEFITTDSQGVAEVAEWVLGSEVGVNRLRAASPGLDSVIFQATGLPDPVFSDQFQAPE